MGALDDFKVNKTARVFLLAAIVVMLFTEHHDLRVPGIALYRYRFGRNRPEAGIWDETRNNV